MKPGNFLTAVVITVLAFPLVGNAKGPPSETVLLKDANGVEIGRVIGMETVGWPYVLTNKGYRTLFRMAPGMVYLSTTVYFESTNCEGTAYFGPGKYIGAVFSPTPYETLAYEENALLYSPINAERVPININTMLDENLQCQPYVVPGAEGQPAYPNNPDITGIKNTAYPARLRIE